MTNNPFDPRGRLRRLVYIPMFGILNLASLGVQSLPFEGLSGQVAYVSCTMFVAWTIFCTMSKRLHDAGKTSILAGINIAFISAAGILRDIDSSQVVTSATYACLAAAMTIGFFVLIMPKSPKAIKYGTDPRIHAANVNSSGQIENVMASEKI